MTRFEEVCFVLKIRPLSGNQVIVLQLGALDEWTNYISSEWQIFSKGSIWLALIHALAIRKILACLLLTWSLSYLSTEQNWAVSVASKINGPNMVIVFFCVADIRVTKRVSLDTKNEERQQLSHCCKPRMTKFQYLNLLCMFSGVEEWHGTTQQMLHHK